MCWNNASLASLHNVHMQHALAFHTSSHALLLQGWESCDPHYSIFNTGHFALVQLSSPSQKVGFSMHYSRWAKASIFISLGLPPWPWRQLPIRALLMDSIEATWGYYKTPRTCLLSQRLGNTKSHLLNNPPTINSKSALRHSHSQAGPKRMEHLPL